MTDNVDFKAAKEWAKASVEDGSAGYVEYAYLALCELLYVEADMYRARIEIAEERGLDAQAASDRDRLARINAAIGE